jgi:hypothetical protein
VTGPAAVHNILIKLSSPLPSNTCAPLLNTATIGLRNAIKLHLKVGNGNHLLLGFQWRCSPVLGPQSFSFELLSEELLEQHVSPYDSDHASVKLFVPVSMV